MTEAALDEAPDRHYNVKPASQSEWLRASGGRRSWLYRNRHTLAFAVALAAFVVAVWVLFQ